MGMVTETVTSIFIDFFKVGTEFSSFRSVLERDIIVGLGR